jgi:hypothetical protein
MGSVVPPRVDKVSVMRTHPRKLPLDTCVCSAVLREIRLTVRSGLFYIDQFHILYGQETCERPPGAQTLSPFIIRATGRSSILWSPRIAGNAPRSGQSQQARPRSSFDWATPATLATVATVEAAAIALSRFGAPLEPRRMPGWKRPLIGSGRAFGPGWMNRFACRRCGRLKAIKPFPVIFPCPFEEDLDRVPHFIVRSA